MAKFTKEITEWNAETRELARNASLDQLGIIRRWVEANPHSSPTLQQCRLDVIERRSKEIAAIRFSR